MVGATLLTGCATAEMGPDMAPSPSATTVDAELPASTWSLDYMPPMDEAYAAEFGPVPDPDDIQGVAELREGIWAEYIADPSAPGGFAPPVSQNFPRPYQEALEVALQDRIVQLAVSLGKISTVRVEVVDNAEENGAFLDGKITFRIGWSDNIAFKSGMAVEIVARHEAAHALLPHSYKGDDASGGDVELERACDTARQSIFEESLAKNRNVIAESFRLAADELQERIDNGAGVPPFFFTPDGNLDAHKVAETIASFDRIAEMIEQNSAPVLNAPEVVPSYNEGSATLDEGNKSCGVTEFAAIIPAALERNDDETRALMDIYDTLSEGSGAPGSTLGDAQNSFSCMTESAALNEEGYPGSIIGHPSESPSEALASFVTVQTINPDFLRGCTNPGVRALADEVREYVELHAPGLADLTGQY